MPSLISIFTGAGVLVVGAMLPGITSDTPSWVQYSLLAIGGGLLIIAWVLKAIRSKTKKHTESKRKSSISVKMGNNNRVGDIGNNINER